MNEPFGEKPGFSIIFVWRLLMFIVAFLAISATYPLYQKIERSGFFPDPRIEITGFQPNERAVVERAHPYIHAELKREAVADERGRAVFAKTTPGNWRVIQGGSEELRRTEFRFPDRHGIFIKKIGVYEIRMIYKRGS